MLEYLGYTVVRAPDSQKAWQLFRKGPEQFDVMMSDQTMPTLTAIDLARRMLAPPPPEW